MKIFVTVGIFPPDIGGPASFVPKISELLAEKSHEVKVLCLSNEEHDDKNSYTVIRIIRSLPKIIRWPKTIYNMIKHGHDADLWFINGLPMEAYIAHKFISIFLRRKVKTIRKIVGDWAWERGRNLKLTEDSFDEFQINKHSLHLEIAKISRGWTAQKVDMVIVPSEHLKKVVKNWGVSENKISVIYNGTKIIKKTNSSPSNNRQLISVGRLAPWKNIDVIIESIEKLNRSHSNKYTLTLVGDGPIRQELEYIIAEKGLEDYIVITGQVSNNEVARYLEEADVYIQASGYEGLPHVVLEAMNHHLSVISTPIGGTNEVLRDGKYGWILPIENGKKPIPNELVRIIEEVENNIEKDNEIKKAAFTMLEKKFDENTNLNKYLEIIGTERKSKNNKSILLFGTTRYSKPLSNSDKNKFTELASVANVSLMTYGNSNVSYEEANVYFENIKEPKNLLAKYLKFYFFSIRKLRKVIKERNVHIVFAKDAFTGFPVVLARKIYKDLKSIKLVIESHGDYREMVFEQRKYFFEKIYKFFVSRVGKLVLKNSDMVRGVTPESIDILNKPENITSIYFPAWVDNNIFTTDTSINKKENQDILFVGNIIPRKGVKFLLEAFDRFASKNNRGSFFLVGDTPNQDYFNECKQHIEKSKYKNRVEFLGKIDQAEISKLMNKSKVLVLASSYEGLPRVLIEAGLCSLPSIAPGIDGIEIPFGEDGGTEIYSLDNYDEFLAHLEKIYSDNEYYSLLTERSYKLSNKLSGKGTFANNWLRMIELVLK